MEKTLILLKPDCVKNKHCGNVIQRFEQAGFIIRGCKMIAPNEATLKEHYAHIVHLPVYPGLETFMQESPVLAMVLEGDQVISKVREMVGPTDSTQAPKGTIRADFGVNKMRNVIHASDSPENAAIEIKRFFSSGEVFNY